MDIVPKETRFDETIDGYAYSVGEMLSGVARDCRRLNRVPKKQDRSRVLGAMLETFELIGGVPRMAMWADLYPGEFYKLFGKQIPGLVQQLNFNGPTQINIQPALPRSALDGPEEPALEPEPTEAT
jgi:hypothetical protein